MRNRSAALAVLFSIASWWVAPSAPAILIELSDLPLEAAVHQRFVDEDQVYYDQVTVFSEGGNVAGGDTVSFSMSFESPLRIRIDPLAERLTLIVGLVAGDPGEQQLSLTVTAQPIWSLLDPQDITNENATSTSRTVFPFESEVVASVIGENFTDLTSDFLTNPNEPGFFRGFQGSFEVPGDFASTNFTQVYFQVSASTDSATPPPILVSVPEPGSLTLLGVGALLLAAGRAPGAQRRGRMKRGAPAR